MLFPIYEEEHQHNLKIYETKYGKPLKGLIYMEFKVNFSLKNYLTSQWSSYKKRINLFHYEEQDIKEWQLSFTSTL